MKKIEEAVPRKLCNEVETVREITYLSDKVSIGGRCEADVTARSRYR